MGKIGKKVREELGILPEQKAQHIEGSDFVTFGIQKLGSKHCFVKVEYIDGKVNKVTKSEPDSKAVALERFKIETARLFLEV